MTKQKAFGLAQRGFLVWSNEHGGWWIEGGLGYTLDISRAGRFTQAEATSIADNASVNGEKPLMDGVMPEVVVLAPEVAPDTPPRPHYCDSCLTRQPIARVREEPVMGPEEKHGRCVRCGDAHACRDPYGAVVVE